MDLSRPFAAHAFVAFDIGVDADGPFTITPASAATGGLPVLLNLLGPFTGLFT